MDGPNEVGYLVTYAGTGDGPFSPYATRTIAPRVIRDRPMPLMEMRAVERLMRKYPADDRRLKSHVTVELYTFSHREIALAQEMEHCEDAQEELEVKLDKALRQRNWIAGIFLMVATGFAVVALGKYFR